MVEILNLGSSTAAILLKKRLKTVSTGCHNKWKIMQYRSYFLNLETVTKPPVPVAMINGINYAVPVLILLNIDWECPSLIININNSTRNVSTGSLINANKQFK